jgi:CRISPR-associated protein Cas2
MDVLVAYDVSTLNPEGERRLARVAAICERFGVRAQYSLFECRLSPAAFQVMLGELLDVIDLDADSINIYRFDRPIPQVRSSYGKKKNVILGRPWIVRGRSRTSSDP